MDRQLLDNIKRIYRGIVVYDLVVIAVMFFIKKMSISTVGGLIAGSIVAMISLFIIAKNIETIVDKTKGMARAFASFGYTVRLAMYGAVLAYAAITKNISVYTVAIGLISTGVVIRVQQLILKKK